jgi:hypothetical protein
MPSPVSSISIRTVDGVPAGSGSAQSMRSVQPRDGIASSAFLTRLTNARWIAFSSA